MVLQWIVSTLSVDLFDLDLAVGHTAGPDEQEHSTSLLKSLLLLIIIKHVLPS